MGRGRKVALAVLWVAAVAVVALRFGGGYEERSVETGRLSVTVLPSDPGAGLPEALKLEIQADIVEGGDRVRLVMELGDVRGADPDGPEIELILDGHDAVYLHTPQGPKLPGGATWVRMDPDEAEKALPGFEGLLKLADSDSLLTTARPFDAEPMGREVIDGVETTRYEDEEVLEKLDDVAGLFDGTFEEMRAAMGDDAVVTLWQDDEGFIRRLAFPIAASYLAPLPDDAQVVLQYTMEDLGEDLTVELPDEGDVAPL